MKVKISANDESITITKPSVSFEISADVRHGVRGYRVIRRPYSKAKRCYLWDERYQFYTSPCSAFAAIISGKFEKGIKSF